jgi:hypothetical protein
MKCTRCRAANPRDAVNCWACGVRLHRHPARGAFQPDAFRYYSSSPVAVGQHHALLDGIVLISTVLFGLMLGYFLAEVLPKSAAGGRSPSLRNPLSLFSPAPRMLDPVAFGSAQTVNGVVAQAVEPRRELGEGGRQAAAGKQFFAATVVIDNQGSGPLAYELSDWQLRDSRGRLISPESIRGAGWLSSGTVNPGDRVQGRIAFLIAEGDPKLQLSFSPGALRSVLRWDAPPPG